MNIKNHIRQRYYEIADQLQIGGQIKAYPKLALTNAKRFWGRIRRYGLSGELIDIRISHNLFQDLYNEQGADALNKKLTDTICHELAHMTYWNHTHLHTNLTELYVATANNTELIVTAASKVETITLSDIVEDPKKARSLLRKANISKPSSRWEWKGQLPEDVKNILGL